jgi:hypothetical protein
MPPKINLTGKRFGQLFVISETEREQNDPHIKWLCQCDCGNISKVSGQSLRKGATKSCGCRQTNKLNLLGCQFGRLKVLKQAGRSKNNSCLWVCQCDCGNIITVLASNLNKGNTRSCGCLRSLPKGQASKNLLLSSYKKGSKRRKLNWELTNTEFDVLTQENCFYCGVSPLQKIQQPGAYGEYIYNGIDRVDNSKGYTIDNCVPCCKMCNYARRNMSFKEYIQFIIRSFKHLEPIRIRVLS